MAAYRPAMFEDVDLGLAALPGKWKRQGGARTLRRAYLLDLDGQLTYVCCFR